MDGYSVTEAASVLGVSTERVWELLARGVLAGAAEGETGMRVFLQPRPAPVTPASDVPRGNGHEREREPESSPFRELLTEFRNLTERYGQALLALGEARGEVASLRGRVELLEARFDLRLPAPAPIPPAPVASWTGTATVEDAAPRPVPSAGAASTIEADAPGSGADAGVADDTVATADEEATHEEGRRRRRRRGQHPAHDEIAEALARADDPSPAELPGAAQLPGAAEAAAAFAAYRESHHPPADDADALLPRELPAAEPIEVADDPDAAEPPEAALATGEAAWPEAADPIGETTTTAADRDNRWGGAELELPEPSPVPEPQVDGMGDEPSWTSWDRERYSTAIEAPDWIPEEVDEAPRSDAAVAGGPSADGGVLDDPWPAEPELVQRQEVERESSLWRGTIDEARERLGLTDDEPTEASGPAATEGDPMAARAPEPADPDAGADGGDAGTQDGPAGERQETAPDDPRPVTGPRPAPPSRAYRRLRRILPG